MTERIFIKPTTPAGDQEPLKVRKPANGYLAADGEWVNRDSYWIRRIADGDAQVVEGAVENEPAKAATSKTGKV